MRTPRPWSAHEPLLQPEFPQCRIPSRYRDCLGRKQRLAASAHTRSGPRNPGTRQCSTRSGRQRTNSCFSHVLALTISTHLLVLLQDTRRNASGPDRPGPLSPRHCLPARRIRDIHGTVSTSARKHPSRAVSSGGPFSSGRNRTRSAECQAFRKISVRGARLARRGQYHEVHLEASHCALLGVLVHRIGLCAAFSVISATLVRTNLTPDSSAPRLRYSSKPLPTARMSIPKT